MVATGKIKRDMLKSDDVFILNTGSEVYVWIGKGATALEKKSGMNYAMQYLGAKKLPPTTRIARILEGGENEQFHSLLA